MRYILYDSRSDYSTEPDSMLESEAGLAYQFMMDELIEMQDVKREATITGKLGLWDGVHEIEPVKCSTFYEAVIRCIGNCDDFEVIKTGNKTIHVNAYHHDGCNRFKITEYK